MNVLLRNSPLARRSGVAAAATALLLTLSAATNARERRVPGLSFRVSTSTRVYPGDTPRAQNDEVMRGRGVAVNGRARIEFLAFTPAPQGITTDDFLIAADSGHSFVLHANNQRYTPSDDMFGGPAVIALSRVLGGGRGGFGGGPGGDGGDAAPVGAPGGGRGPGGFGGRGGARGAGGPPPGAGAAGRGPRGGRGRGIGASGFLSQVELLDVKALGTCPRKTEKLGAGETIDGRPTQHVRITTDYRILWGDQSLPAHAVTEMWTAKLPAAIPNPFEPLVVADQSTDGPLVEYALKLRNVRAQLEGTPVKVVTTTTIGGVRDVVGLQGMIGNDPTVDHITVVQQTEIRNVTPADVDPKLVEIPENPGA